MAPVLQCPDCGTKHPLASVPESGAFACRGCGRVLKVPDAPAAARAPVPAAAGRPDASPPATPPVPVPAPTPVATAVASHTAAPEVEATRAVPKVDSQAFGALSAKSLRPATRLGHVPWYLRLLLWIVAVPLSFLLVFMIARALSFFTTNQLSDVFLANDTARFWPVARLLPFVALLTATFVQAGVYFLARLRGKRGDARSAGELSGPGSPRRAR